ncbi:MAG: hypothetical protein JO159_15885 [Acidobacteria bacterium]|nr:hypothetical protein [Acidobacteriota bacterium]
MSFATILLLCGAISVEVDPKLEGLPTSTAGERKKKIAAIARDSPK